MTQTVQKCNIWLWYCECALILGSENLIRLPGIIKPNDILPRHLILIKQILKQNIHLDQQKTGTTFTKENLCQYIWGKFGITYLYF